MATIYDPGPGRIANSGSSSFGSGWGESLQPYRTNVQLRAPAAAGGGGATNAGDAQLAEMLKRQQQNYQQEIKARYEKLMGLANQFGAAQTAQSGQMLQQQMAQGQSSLIDRGLGNSTVVDSVNQNAQDLHSRRLLEINERKAAMQMGVVSDQQPQAPDMSMYASLFGQARSGGQPLAQSLAPFRMFSSGRQAA